MAVPTDLADRTSPRLEAVVRRVLDDPDRSEDASLAMVREAVAAGLVEDMIRDGALEEGDRRGLARELDELVEELGGDVPAVHLLRYRAPPTLSTVIRAVMARWDDADSAPTLLHVREAVDRGLLGELAGEGTIDPDMGDLVLPQLDALIRLHGEHALAEELVASEDETLQS